MKLVVFVALLGASVGLVEAEQSGRQRLAPPSAETSSQVAEAYDQFLFARRLENANDTEGAIAAYKRAMALDPLAADIVSDLANLYLQRNRMQDAIATAEQALKIAPANRDAHRVLGLIYSTLTTPGSSRAPRVGGTPQENLAKAIQHLELALDRQVGVPDASLRATMSRLYVAAGQYDKAIPMLSDLVKREPDWQDGPALLAEAYVSAGRAAEAIGWLEEAAADNPRLYRTLADFYGRERRWQEAATAYDRALQLAPRSFDLKVGYATALLNAGGKDALVKARDLLTDALSTRSNDARALYLLSQAQRRMGDFGAAEASARRLIARNAKSPWGYYSLAETLERRQNYQGIVDALAPAVASFRSGGNDASFELGLLLPHLGLAYQELGQLDRAIAVLDEAHKVSPSDPATASYLIHAQIAAKKYSEAAELARAARAQHPDDLRLARLEARALSQSGKADQGIAMLKDLVQKHRNDPSAHVALAQVYSDANRDAQAVKVLQDAQAMFPPEETSITFELGAVFNKQKRYADAEAAFRQLLARDPENAAALNYLGYMLAERGKRLDESVGYLKKALQLEPDNGSFLDSLGWAYYKSGRLDLAADNLKRAAEQLANNSVIQDHYGDVLFKLGRYDEAIAVWMRALSGDGDSIDRGGIDKKIRSARQKLQKR